MYPVRLLLDVVADGADVLVAVLGLALDQIEARARAADLPDQKKCLTV